MREHGVDAWHRERLGDVDRDDAGVGVRAPDGVSPEHPRRPQVAGVGEPPGGLGNAVAPRNDLADPTDLEPARSRGDGAMSRSRTTPLPLGPCRGAGRPGGLRHLRDRLHHTTALTLMRARRQPDRVEDLLVARAAAEVAGQRLADLVVGRARHAGEQVGGRDDEPGRAEAALDRARLDERALHRVQLVPLGQPLDRHHLVPVGLGGEHEARADEPPSRSTEHEPHSPCSHAFFDPAGRAARAARRAGSRRPRRRPRARSPLTVSSILIRGTAPARVARARPARAAGTPPFRARRRSGSHAATTRSGNATTPPRSATRPGPATGAGRAERRAAARRARDRRDHGERADRDHHRVSRPDLHERLRRAGRRRRAPPTISSSAASAFRFGPTRNSSQRHASARPARSRPPPTRPRRAAAAARRPPARRCRGCRRASRGCGSAASRPCATPRRAPAGAPTSGASHRLGVGQAGAEPQRAVLAATSRAAPATPFRFESAVGPRAVEVELDHHVGAALDRHGSGCSALMRSASSRLVGRDDLRGLSFLAHVRDAEGSGCAEPPPREAGRDEDENDDRHHVRQRRSGTRGRSCTPCACSAEGSAGQPAEEVGADEAELRPPEREDHERDRDPAGAADERVAVVHPGVIERL